MQLALERKTDVRLDLYSSLLLGFQMTLVFSKSYENSLRTLLLTYVKDTGTDQKNDLGLGDTAVLIEHQRYEQDYVGKRCKTDPD